MKAIITTTKLGKEECIKIVQDNLKKSIFDNKPMNNKLRGYVKNDVLSIRGFGGGIVKYPPPKLIANFISLEEGTQIVGVFSKNIIYWLLTIIESVIFFVLGCYFLVDTLLNYNQRVKITYLSPFFSL